MANTVLNESPNSNVAMCVPNNVHLTTMGAHQFSMMAAQTPCRKANLPETRDNDTKIRKVGADRN